MINKIVNLDLHPINTSKDYMDSCKKKLKNNSVLQLDNFLLSKSLKKKKKKANYLNSKD